MQTNNNKPRINSFSSEAHHHVASRHLVAVEESVNGGAGQKKSVVQAPKRQCYKKQSTLRVSVSQRIVGRLREIKDRLRQSRLLSKQAWDAPCRISSICFRPLRDFETVLLSHTVSAGSTPDHRIGSKRVESPARLPQNVLDIGLNSY